MYYLYIVRADSFRWIVFLFHFWSLKERIAWNFLPQVFVTLILRGLLESYPKLFFLCVFEICGYIQLQHLRKNTAVLFDAPRDPCHGFLKDGVPFFYRNLTLLNRLLLKNRAFNIPRHRFFLNHDLTVSSAVTVQYMLYIQLYSTKEFPAIQY